MPQYNILILPGDGIGPEITLEAVKVLQAFETRDVQFNLQTHLIGGSSIDRHGKPITDTVKQAALASDAVLFAAVGGPKWDHARRGLDGPEGGLLQLRKAMDVYANLRPCSADSPSRAVAREFTPFRAEVIEGVEFVVVRENCGGAYFGEKVEEENYGISQLALVQEPVRLEKKKKKKKLMVNSHGPLGLLNPRNPTHHTPGCRNRPAP